MEQRALDFVIKINPEAASFAENLPLALEKITSMTDYTPETIGIILTQEELAQNCAAKCEETLRKFEGQYLLCPQAELADAVTGMHVIILEQPDEVGENILTGIGSILRKKRNGIIFQNKNAKTEEFRSIYSPACKERLSVFGAVIRRDLITDFRRLLACNLETAEEILRIILSQEGYYVTKQPLIESSCVAMTDFALTENFADTLISYSREKLGEVTDYLQSCILSVIGQNIEMHGKKECVVPLLEQLDAENIASFKGMDERTRLYLLNMKYDRNILEEAELRDDGKVYFDDIPLFSVTRKGRIKLNVTTIKDNAMTLEGTTDLHLLGNAYRLYVSDKNDVLYPLELIPFAVKDQVGLDGEIYYQGYRFTVTIPLEEGNDYEFILEDEDLRDFQIDPDPRAYSRLNPTGKSYFVKDGYMIKLRKNRLYVTKNHWWRHCGTELGYLLCLLRMKKLYTVFFRILYWLSKPWVRKPVWIVADRPHVAGDNGEHMFRYLMEETDASKDHSIYFLISKESKDYERIRSIGKVLPHNSLKHHVLALHAKLIVSAAGNNLALNAFGKVGGQYYRDVCDFNFVYLRHGVSHNDQSVWLNRLNKNIRILVATCKPEYQGILDGAYCYTDREVRMTGLARYDNLYDEREKKIAILPTWRKNLEGKLMKGTSKRESIPNFKDTDYFQFYNSLINDERLLAVMKEYGYTGCFYLHPVFEAQFEDFKSSELITVGNGIADYQKIFRESALMVTDYSSVAFDFAYLKKPVIYSQFDEKDFYKNHSWGKGYFTYREDGFGPITTTLDETVETLIDYIKDDCRMREEYVRKVENFFAYTDRNNRKRIYEAIMEIAEEK